MMKNPFQSAFAKLLSGLLALTMMAPVSAQEAPTEGIHLRSLAFVLGVRVPQKVYAHGVGAGQANGIELKVKTFLNHEADVLPQGMRKFVLTTDVDAASTKVAEKLVAKVQLPDDLKSGILLFVPGTGEAGAPPFRILPVNDSRRSFPEGSIKVLNMTPTEVLFQLEEKKFQFMPGKMQLIEGDEIPVDNAGLTGMRAFCRIGEGNSASAWKRIASSQWAPPGRKRVFQVLFIDPTSQEVQLRGFTDIAAIER